MSEDRQVLTDAFKFHGHICWASVLVSVQGFRRSGSWAQSAPVHPVTCTVSWRSVKNGAQCFADGVQYATGCTLGKGNIAKAWLGKAGVYIDRQKKGAIDSCLLSIWSSSSKGLRFKLYAKTGAGNSTNENPRGRGLGDGRYHFKHAGKTRYSDR